LPAVPSAVDPPSEKRKVGGSTPPLPTGDDQANRLVIDCTTVTVRVTLAERQDGSLVIGPPKSEAGRRTVTIPTAIRPDVRAHLRDFVPDDPDVLVFTGAKGAPLRRSNFQRACTGPPPSPRPAYRASTSTTFGTPETPSPRAPARASLISWPRWATAPPGPR
jgi:hypothetical protein